MNRKIIVTVLLIMTAAVLGISGCVTIIQPPAQTTSAPTPSVTPQPSPTPSQPSTPIITVPPIVTPIPVPFAVTGIIANVDTPNYDGPCPRTLNFYANVAVNGPGTVTYRWERSDNAMSQTQSLVFTAAGSQTASDSWQLGSSYSGWLRLHVLTPVEAVSNQVYFSINCSSGSSGSFYITGITISVDPATYTGPCPKTVNFSAIITASGPGVVTYKWERSDGAIASTESVTFSAAGAKTVTTSWTRGGGTGWQRLHILTPNDVVSGQLSFTLTCVP